MFRNSITNTITEKISKQIKNRETDKENSKNDVFKCKRNKEKINVHKAGIVK